MIAAILLAAGSARRFDGSQKLLAPVAHGDANSPLVRRSAEGLLEAGLPRIVVVLGHEGERVRDALDRLGLQFVVNHAYASGMSSSLATGVSAAIQFWPKADALLVALGDQPLGGTGVLEVIVAAVHNADEHSRTIMPRPIVAPRFRGQAGNPVLFARELVPELLTVSGDRGAREVVDREPSRVYYIDFDQAMPPDIDTVSDLSGLTRFSR